jgi:hypothetical protein
MANAVTSIRGRKLGLGVTGELISNDIQISRPCVNATITVGAEAANVRAITIQLLDADGQDIDYAETVEIIMYLDAAQRYRWCTTCCCSKEVLSSYQ